MSVSPSISTATTPPTTGASTHRHSAHTVGTVSAFTSLQRTLPRSFSRPRMAKTSRGSQGDIESELSRVRRGAPTPSRTNRPYCAQAGGTSWPATRIRRDVFAPHIVRTYSVLSLRFLPRRSCSKTHGFGACAQVAIWTGARHMHQRHKYNWLSVADITRLAAPTAAEESTSLPAGSDFSHVGTDDPRHS